MVTVLYFTPSVEDDNEEAARALEELKNELVERIDKLTEKYPSIQRARAPFGSLERSRRCSDLSAVSILTHSLPIHQTFVLVISVPSTRELTKRVSVRGTKSILKTQENLD